MVDAALGRLSFDSLLWYFDFGNFGAKIYFPSLIFYLGEASSC